jgi:hypothetical protein
MKLQQALDVFVLTTRNTSCAPKWGFQVGSCMEQDRNVILVELWTSYLGKLEEKSDPDIRRSCQETVTQVAGACRGRGLKESVYTVWPIRKDLVVMSQWAQHPWNLESPEAAPAWPVAMAAQPAKQEEVGGRCPCLVWKTSQLSGA